MAGGGQAAPLGQDAGLCTAERALVMAVMVSVPMGRMWRLVALAVQPRAASASVAAKAGERGLFGGRSLLVEWHGCMMSW